MPEMETRVDTKHQWVKHVLTPVEVLQDDKGEPVILVDPDQQIISEDHAAYGCDRCGVPMVGNLKTDCTPDEDD